MRVTMYLLLTAHVNIVFAPHEMEAVLPVRPHA